MSTRKDVSSRVASPPFELKGSKLSDAKKSADTLDTEAVLRQKLLKRQQEKTGARHTSDDEDVLRNRRETGARRHETSSKAEPLRRTREEEERHGSEARERERANRKPIRWEDSKEREERQRSHTDSKRHKAKDDRLSDRRTLSYRRESPLKRKLDDPRETRTERSSDIRQSDDRHHHRHRHEKHHRHERSSERRMPEPPRRDGAPSSSSMRRSVTTVGDLAPSGRDVRGLSAEARHEPELVSRSSEGSLRAKLLTSPIADKAPILPLPAANLSEVKATAVGISPSDLQPTSAGEEEPGEVADMAEPSTLHLSDVSTPSPLADFGASPVELTSMETEEREEVAKEEEETSDTDDYRPIAYKKSRFESSPEMDDDGDVSFEDDLNSNDAMDVEDLDESIMNLSELERKGFDELTDEDKARLSPDTLERMEKAYQHRLIARLPVYYPGISGCRNVNEFECVNRIEEGTFGVVFRAVEKKTDETVALKRLKMENELNGFPITSLREINMLWKCGRHPNIVNLREIVVGSNMDKIYLVMDYIDHDVKALMETMSKKGKTFTMGQVKALMQQLLYGVQHLHQEYVIHRDLKTSNLLLTRNGILKIGDFGLAREYGDPLKPYTPIVVTLWYRSPELLLGVKEYSTAVDMWSVGCIFGEFLQFKPLFPGRGEIDQLNKIFTEIGTPNEKIWPGYSKLPGVVKFAFVDTPYNQLRRKFKDGKEFLTDEGFELLNRLLAPCPKRRHSASTALHSKWFREDPLPVDPSLFPTWPSKSDAFCKDKPQPSAAPKIPPGLSAAQLKLMEDLKVDAKHMKGDGGFSLKFDAAKF